MANDSGRKRKEETKRKSNLEAFKEELKQLAIKYSMILFPIYLEWNECNYNVF